MIDQQARPGHDSQLVEVHSCQSTLSGKRALASGVAAIVTAYLSYARERRSAISFIHASAYASFLPAHAELIRARQFSETTAQKPAMQLSGASPGFGKQQSRSVLHFSSCLAQASCIGGEHLPIGSTSSWAGSGK